ncbi:MAG: hypothetical protein EBU46_00055 [Nitrosomonadaceae bacterium]|nr:hypothetical protein [Nitrosomonadaceae bacterium]
MIIKINNEDVDVVAVEASSNKHQRSNGQWYELPLTMHKQLYESFHGQKLPSGSMKDGYASFMSCGLNS